MAKELTMPKITFVNEKKEIEVPAGANLRAEARKAGIELHPWIFKYPGLNCMGNGLCATCRVLVKNGMENLSKPGFVEKLSLNTIHAFESIGYEEEMRLACQCTVNGDCTVETKPALNISGETFWQKPYPNK
jgi:ferredoxin